MSSSPQTAWSIFVNDPLGALKELLTPAPSAQELANDRIRATGIDPGTLSPLNPSFAPQAFNPEDPNAYAKAIQDEVASEYNAEVAAAESSFPVGGPLGNGDGVLGLPNGSGVLIAIVWVAIVVIILIFVLKAA